MATPLPIQSVTTRRIAVPAGPPYRAFLCLRHLHRFRLCNGKHVAWNHYFRDTLTERTGKQVSQAIEGLMRPSERSLSAHFVELQGRIAKESVINCSGVSGSDRLSQLTAFYGLSVTSPTLAIREERHSGW